MGYIVRRYWPCCLWPIWRSWMMSGCIKGKLIVWWQHRVSNIVKCQWLQGSRIGRKIGRGGSRSMHCMTSLLSELRKEANITRTGALFLILIKVSIDFEFEVLHPTLNFQPQCVCNILKLCFLSIVQWANKGHIWVLLLALLLPLFFLSLLFIYSSRYSSM